MKKRICLAILVVAMMQTGLDQARRGESSPLNEAFARLRAEI